MTITRRSPALAAGFLALACAALRASPSPADPARAPERLAADFTMTRTLSVLSDAVTSKGRLVLGGPGRLRFEVTEPSRSILVIDSGRGWLRYPDAGVTRGFELGADPVMRVLSEHLLVLTGGDLGRAAALYTVSEGDAPGVRRLVPKQPEIAKLFAEMRVAIGDGGIVSWVELVAANGDVTRIAFSNVRVNPALDASLFEKP